MSETTTTEKQHSKKSAFVPPELEMLSSQESNMGDDELNNMVTESEPATTKRNTSWGMTKWIKWIEKRNINVDLTTVKEEKLNELLRKFYAEVKPEKKNVTH